MIPVAWGERMLSTPFSDRTVPSLLERGAAAAPDRTLFTWRGAATSIDQANRAANVLARRLQELGVASGSRVAVMMSTSPEYLTLWLALGKLGAVEVPINTAYKGTLLAYQLAQAEVVVAIVDEGLSTALTEVSAEVATLQRVLVNGSAPAGDSLQTFLEGASEENLGNVIDPESLACIMYTSGTTGPSKGVMLSHYGIAGFGYLYADITALTDDDVVLNFSPFHHVAGKFLAIACLVTKARMVLRDYFSVTTFWDEVRADGVTNFAAIGGVCNMLCGAQPKTDDAQNPVRVVYAVPAPGQLYDEFEERFDLKLVEAYGSTEVGLVLSTSLDESLPGTCGRPNDFYEVAVVDQGGTPAPDGESGEIVIRSSDRLLMSLGYDHMPERTAEAWRDGWFHTGDRARRDVDGRFWFLDRVKDTIRRRGENISSYEVERVLGSHPDVVECAAVAAPSEVGEDEVRVVVVLRDGGHLEPEALFRWCVDQMAYFMVPRYIDLVTELPRTPTAKVEKYKLRTDGVTTDTWDAAHAGLRVTRSGLVESAASSTSPGGGPV